MNGRIDARGTIPNERGSPNPYPAGLAQLGRRAVLAEPSPGSGPGRFLFLGGNGD